MKSILVAGMAGMAVLFLCELPGEARACEALIGAEYTDPVETIPLGLDPSDWLVASRSRNEAVARKDVVKTSETLSDWSELVSWQLTFGSKVWNLEQIKNDFVTTVGYVCNDVKSAVLSKGERELVYEWWHGECYDRPAQHHIERLVVGQIGTHLLSYGRKGPKLKDAERDAWARRLSKLEIKSRAPTGELSPLQRARMAVWTRDYAKALELLRPLAEQGDAEAQDELAGMYAGGWGIPQDYAKALEWFRKAAAQKNAVGTYNVGRIYDNGWGVAKDPAEALRWYRAAAELGEPDAQGRLGYLLATAPEPSYAEAAKWFRTSIERGHEHGVYWIGRLHEEGWGLPKDLKQALRLYREAAVAGDPDAQARLGVLYRDGRGVERDDEKARLWVVRAAAQGNPDALALYDAYYRPRIPQLPAQVPPGVMQTPAQTPGASSSLPVLPPGFSYPQAGAQNPAGAKGK